MKKTCFIMGILLLFQGIITGQMNNTGQRRFRSPAWKILDKDQNGIISAMEMTQAPMHLKSLDRNGDGRLTGDEIRSNRRRRGNREGEGREQGQRGRMGRSDGFRGPILSAVDTDGNGVLSQLEISRATSSLRKLDVNDDGELTVEEVRQNRRRRNRSDLDTEY